jgi:beta-phosphoglucomutase-like phosphatase (HAD superfamily)
VKAILVDLDGTLVDTRESNLAAYKASILEHGLDFDPYILEQTVGHLAWREMLSCVLPMHSDKYLSIAERKRELYKHTVKNIKVNKTLEFFLRLQYGTVPIALVTSASRASVEVVLQVTNLNNLFTAVVTSDDVLKQKPDPAPYFKASFLLNISPQECIVFEDSDVGVAAGRAFGAQVWRVMW